MYTEFFYYCYFKLAEGTPPIFHNLTLGTCGISYHMMILYDCSETAKQEKVDQANTFFHTEIL